MRIVEKNTVPRHASDVYASLTLQPQPTSAKMLRLNKKTFDCFTQRNIRRNLISANHVKQMKLCKDLQHIVRAEGGKEDVGPLAKSVTERAKIVSRKGVGTFSKPAGKLVLSESIGSPPSPSYSGGKPPAKTQRGGATSLEKRPAASCAPGPSARGIHPASGVSESLKEGAAFIQPPLPSTVPQASKPPSINAATSYSFTDSDLISDNSFLKGTFPSLPSSTQTTFNSAPSPIQSTTKSARPVVGVDTFIAVGAGPNYPLGNSEEGMSDMSLVVRPSRNRLSRTRVSTLRVLGKDYGCEVLAALRMAFKTYEPAVVLMKKSLKDPSFEGEGEAIEKFALRLMSEGVVELPSELRMLLELLQTTEDVLDRVLAREQEVKQRLPGQKIQDFAADGPVRTRLSEVINAIGLQEEEEEEKQQKENAILAAEFDADSFRVEETFQESQSIDEINGGGQDGAITTSPTAVRERSLEHGSQGHGKGEPEKKKSRPSSESVFDEQNLADCEEILRAEASSRKTPPSIGGSSLSDMQTVDAKLVRKGQAALAEFKKIGAGDLLPSDDSDEEMTDEHVTARNPKGKVRFLLGPMDPRSKRRYINAGPAPFTGETAREHADMIKKAKLALINSGVGGKPVDAKQLAALEKLTSMKAGQHSYGVQSDGFQLLRAYVDPANYKKNPCDDSKKVAWEYSTEYTDSQCRYLPWFILIAKMHRRYMMPKPEKAVIDPNWTELETKTYLKDHEAEYIKSMKGGENRFLHALADEIRADDDQTTYAIRMFYKAYMKQGEGVKE